MIEITSMKLSDLRPYENNPRKNDAAVPRMMAVIQEFGFRLPMLVRSNGEIIDGHLRYKAAKKMSLDEVPVVVADDFSEAQIRAFRIMINRSATWAEWDDDLLLQELRALQDSGFDLELTGFENRELDEMLMAMEHEKDPDMAPESPLTPVSITGDLWVLGDHRLLCGDCRNADTAQRLMDSDQLDMLWTDPPYNVDYAGKNKTLNSHGKGTRIQTPIAADKMPAKNFEKFLMEAFKTCGEFLRPGAAIYVAHPPGPDAFVFWRAFMETGFHLVSSLVWRKNVMVIGRGDYHYQHEPILYGWKPGAAHKWYGGRKQKSLFELDVDCLRKQDDNTYQLCVGDKIFRISGENLLAEEMQSTVLSFPKPQSSRLHPTMKPVALVERMVSNSSPRGGLVGDFFGGSGTTLIACERLGRKSRLIEIDPSYVDVIVRRWEELTGKQAFCADTGETFKQVSINRKEEMHA